VQSSRSRRATRWATPTSVSPICAPGATASGGAARPSSAPRSQESRHRAHHREAVFPDGPAADARRILSAIPPDARVLYASPSSIAHMATARMPTGYARCSSAFPPTARSGSGSPMRSCGSVRPTARFATWRKCGGCVPRRRAKQSPTRDNAAGTAGRAIPDARAAFDRFLRIMEVTAPYQAALAEVDGIEGPLVGRRAGVQPRRHTNARHCVWPERRNASHRRPATSGPSIPSTSASAAWYGAVTSMIRRKRSNAARAVRESPGPQCLQRCSRGRALLRARRGTHPPHFLQVANRAVGLTEPQERIGEPEPDRAVGGNALEHLA